MPARQQNNSIDPEIFARLDKTRSGCWLCGSDEHRIGQCDKIGQVAKRDNDRNHDGRHQKKVMFADTAPRSIDY